MPGGMQGASPCHRLHAAWYWGEVGAGIASLITRGLMGRSVLSFLCGHGAKLVGVLVVEAQGDNDYVAQACRLRCPGTGFIA